MSEKYNKQIFNKDSFILKIDEGAVIPMHHPHYYNNRKNIELYKCYRDIHSTVEIEKSTYFISYDTFNKVEKFVRDNFDTLVEIAKRQENEDYEGGYNRIIVKVDAILIIIDAYNTTNKEDFNYINLFKKQIVDMLTKNN